MRKHKVLNCVGDSYYIRWKNDVVEITANRGFLAMNIPTNTYGYGLGKANYPVFRPKMDVKLGIIYMATVVISTDKKFAIVHPIKHIHYPPN